MQDIRPCVVSDHAVLESDTEKQVVLPGFEVSQPQQKASFSTLLYGYSAFPAIQQLWANTIPTSLQAS